MKEKFLAHKKKIIVSILIIASVFFPPVAKLLPTVEIIMPQDKVEIQHEQK